MSIESPAYWAIHFHRGKVQLEDFLPAWTDFPFESFMDEDEVLIGYVQEGAWSPEAEIELEERLTPQGIAWEKKHIPAQNWNTVWEAGFDPVFIPGWCLVRAEFHDPQPGFEHEIVIRPQMAFGTGHHETTYMMLESLKRVEVDGKDVLDYGCGTGILAILAAKLGARKVIGIDIESPAIENAYEHSLLNNTPEIEWKEGDLSVVEQQTFDVILANINRNVLLASAKGLRNLLRPGGVLITSGILDADRDIIINAFQRSGLSAVDVQDKGIWLAITFQ
jgi:ribosomal protein L11 methyltransferase